MNNVIAVVVTMRRPRELRDLLDALGQQTRRPDCIIVVENEVAAVTREIVAGRPDVLHIASARNLGGAGGFGLGILTALSRGASHVWLMDDDGLPEADTCLEDLLAVEASTGADVTSPVILDLEDSDVLAFPYFVEGCRVTRRDSLKGRSEIRHFAHLFNGALVTAHALERFGIPDYRLFLRGDEIDFLHRVLRNGGLVVTATEIGFRHPSGKSETFPLMGTWLNAVVPAGDFKQYHFFRNRGYLLRRHKLWRQALSDILRYPLYYLVSRRGDWKGLRRWLSLMRQGWREQFWSHGSTMSGQTHSVDSIEARRRKIGK